MTNGDAESYLRRAQESLTGAESECAAQRFNNCVNRAYDTAFRAAIAVLLREGIRSRRRNQWPHEFVQAEFAGKLINRRRRYLPELRSTLLFLQALRNRADYETEEASASEAARALRRSREFVDAIRSGGS